MKVRHKWLSGLPVEFLADGLIDILIEKGIASEDEIREAMMRTETEAQEQK